MRGKRELGRGGDWGRGMRSYVEIGWEGVRLSRVNVWRVFHQQCSSVRDRSSHLGIQKEMNAFWSLLETSR